MGSPSLIVSLTEGLTWIINALSMGLRTKVWITSSSYVTNEGLSEAGNLFPPDSFSSFDNADLLLHLIKKQSKA